jgi:hypothetical protein
VSAVNQLRLCASQRQYEESARLYQVLLYLLLGMLNELSIQAVTELVDHFKSYQNIPQIATVKATVNNIRNDLKLDIFEVFESA